MNKKGHFRANEIVKLIDFISKKGFITDGLNFDKSIQIDLEKLTMSGHSFGGLTAVLASGID